MEKSGKKDFSPSVYAAEDVEAEMSLKHQPYFIIGSLK
jgi:hypothetical protein